MSIILSIYSPEAFKEYLLPAVVNEEYSLILEQELFGLNTDIRLDLEATEYQWSYLPSAHYRVDRLDGNQYVPYRGQKLEQDDLFRLYLAGGQILSIMVEVTDVTFAVFEKFEIQMGQTIKIGSADTNDIQYNRLKLVSGEHAAIYQKNDQYVIDVKERSNGAFVNFKRVVGIRQLEFGDHINIFGFDLIYLDKIMAVSTTGADVTVRRERFQKYQPQQIEPLGQKTEKEPVRRLFHRSPRQIYKLVDDVIEIEAPPNPKEWRRRPLGMIIGPSFTMMIPMLLGSGLSIYSAGAKGTGGGVFMYTGIVTAVSSALIGVMWALVNLNYEKKSVREHETLREDAYRKYLDNCDQSIKEKYDRNAAAMRAMYLPAEECCQYSGDTMSLWNRNVEHDDFLAYRLGIGDVPFQAEVRIPKERFTLVNDALAENPGMLQERYRTLHDVPICIDFRERRIVGIIGGDKKRGAVGLLHSLTAQIAAANCYTDVKMAFIYNEGIDVNNNWEYLKWFPHIWSEDRKLRYIARNKSEAGDVLYEITRALRERTGQERVILPHYILFIAAPEFLEGELITSYIYEKEKEYGLTTVFLADSYEDLPNSCNYIIQNDAQFQGVYHIDDDMEERIRIQFDTVSDIQLERFARTLSDIRVNERETGGELPAVLTFLDMYHVRTLDELNVTERWRRNRTYDSMKVLIGEKAGGTPWHLDVHEKYHGPHGLVAGTTGSGKSELLQTFILSLAMNFSPDDVGFFLIDYKGGGMANLFGGLPHMMGQISNLSGNQVKRAMVSIKSENRRRQRIFKENGVNNINLYTRLYKNREASEPVPHIFIVIDEFAELKREEPDFMRELISVAQVGRSLGVHLILATQKPSGTVDDNIWSNSKFRLCLRVQDKQDSNDMLHKPDAAYLTQAGRCYMQVGNDELYELFQSGWSGAEYDEDSGQQRADIANMLSFTGKTALVGSRTVVKQKEAAKKAWIGRLLGLLESTGILSDEEEPSDQKMVDFFAALQAEGIDYPYSEYNSQRIRDLCRAYRGIQPEDSASVQPAEMVLSYADKCKLKLPEQKEKTQLDAIVSYLNLLAEENGYQHNLQLWLPVLPGMLYLWQLQGFENIFDGQEWGATAKEWRIEVPIGLYDDPVNQMQDTLYIDLSQNGHHAVVGTVASGKSTLLQTLVYALVMKYTPRDINIYAIDYSAKMLSAFEGMPHVGGVVYEGEEEKLAKFFGMADSILQERKKLLRGGNYSQYVRANGVQIPAVLIVIDNFARFRTKTNDAYENTILQLVKEGVGCGIFLVITAGGFGMLELPTRIADNLRTVISLEMSDKYQYIDVMRTTRLDTLPEVNVKGRGIARVGGDILEFQTALASEAEDAFQRIEAIQTLAVQMQGAWDGKGARRIPEIPEKPVWEEFVELDEVRQMFEDDRHIPIGYDYQNAAVYGIDLSRTFCYLITGGMASGKTNLLRVLLRAVLEKGGKTVVIDFNDEFRMQADSGEFEYLPGDEEIFRYFSSMASEIAARNGRKKINRQKNASDEELYQDMRQFTPVYILIANLADFIQHINSPKEGVGDMKGFFQNVTDKGGQSNIYWFAVCSQEDCGKIASDRIFLNFKKFKTGIHFGGNVNSQNIFNFDHVHYSERGKVLKRGIGMLPYNEVETVTKVVVPLCRS